MRDDSQNVGYLALDAFAIFFARLNDKTLSAAKLRMTRKVPVTLRLRLNEF